MEGKIQYRNGEIWLMLSVVWVVVLIGNFFLVTSNGSIDMGSFQFVLSIVYLVIILFNCILSLILGLSFITLKSYLTITPNTITNKRLYKTTTISIEGIISLKLKRKYFRNAIWIETKQKTFYLIDDYKVAMNSIFENIKKQCIEDNAAFIQSDTV